MREDRAEALAVLAEALRAPLSRVRLGAERIGRTDLSPLSSELLSELDGAVTDLDRRIDRLCEALRPRDAHEVDDCGRVLDETLARLSPMLAARGTPCRAPVEGGPVPGDALRVRRAAIELMRGAGRLGIEGQLVVQLLTSEDLVCGVPAVRVCGVAALLEGHTPIPADQLQRVHEDLESFGAVEDARFESPGSASTTPEKWTAAFSWDASAHRSHTMPRHEPAGDVA